MRTGAAALRSDATKVTMTDSLMVPRGPEVIIDIHDSR